MRRATRVITGLALWLGHGVIDPATGQATTPPPTSSQFRVCLKQDMSALVDLTAGDRATTSTWTLYGVNARVEKAGLVVKNWFFADANDGCFLMPLGSASYTVKIRPQSASLDGSNTVEVRDSSGSLPTFSAVATMGGTGGATYNVTMPSKQVSRVYTVLAFAIERAFHGLYTGQDLTGWIDNNAGPCVGAGSRACIDPATGDPHIEITSVDATRKFVIGHEYGHATMMVAVGDWPIDCSAQSLDDSGSPNHRLRGRESASCAGGEGFAHYVAADMFNWHNSGTGSANPQAEYQYLDDGIWNLGDGSGSCPPYPLAAVPYPTSSPRPLYTGCAPTPLADTLIGIEMDWARLFWDHHEDTYKPGSVRNHSQMHSDMAAGGPWSTYDTYLQIKSGMSGAQQDRWEAAASWNGVCRAGVSC